MAENSRARSTKTRIETSYIPFFNPPHHHSRARSTKTRIETGESMTWLIEYSKNSRARSTKTRIETMDYALSGTSTDNRIREQDPLKQGLKHKILYVFI